MNETYRSLEPADLWRHFAALNEIPRPSGQEAAARSYIQQIAEDAGATWRADEAGNIVVRVPAKSTFAAAPVVAIQAHLDMVCEKDPDVVHDFAHDAIRPQRDGDFIYASGTTLGADNGIGAAAALALLTTPGLNHGPLELIFTVEEETGLYGAKRLDPALIEAEILINLDSEDPGELIVGCAGGAGTSLFLPAKSEITPKSWQGSTIRVSGLKGGHSGIQIHEPLANAIKLLARVLCAFQQDEVRWRLRFIDGGSAHNAIPRDAVAQIVVAPEAVESLKSAVEAQQVALKNEWAQNEPHLARNIEPTARAEQCFAPQVQSALLQLLVTLPHGVLAMSQSFAGKVQTSTNLARVHMDAREIEIATSSRSFLAGELDDVQKQIRKTGEANGARVLLHDGYPGWEPNPQSRLLEIARAEYATVFGRAPQVEVVHAGLECGVIVSKKPAMDAISFGPLIRCAHSPQEHVAISTVLPIWQLLIAMLTACARTDAH
jgi:dipeptidase D